MMVQVHINRTIIPYQLYFAGHSVEWAGIAMLRAMETKKMSRLWASATRAFQTPSGEMGAPPKLQSLSTRIFLGHPCHQFHRLCLVCLSIFL